MELCIQSRQTAFYTHLCGEEVRRVYCLWLLVKHLAIIFLVKGAIVYCEKCPECLLSEPFRTAVLVQQVMVVSILNGVTHRVCIAALLNEFLRPLGGILWHIVVYESYLRKKDLKGHVAKLSSTVRLQKQQDKCKQQIVFHIDA